MHVLPLEARRTNMKPLNVLYHSPSDFSEKDVLTIIYKDLDNGEKLVHEIFEPEIEIYIVKESERSFSQMRDWMEYDRCDKLKVKYRTRWFMAAKKLGLANGNEAKTSPFVFGADIVIENYYLMQFLREYPTTKRKPLSLSFLDIESDVVRYEKIPPHGEAPINAITYIDNETKTSYTQVLINDDLPNIPEGHPQYEFVNGLRNSLYDTADKIMAIPNYIENKCHAEFDAVYPDYDYHILYYKDERELLTDLFNIMRRCDNDFTCIWNISYDMGCIIKRMEVLGMDVCNTMCDPELSFKSYEFKEDLSPIAHKRRHTITTYTKNVFVDDMIHYGAIRAGGGKIPTLKLTEIAKKELGDEKYDYSEISEFRYMFYQDLEKFILYNIKDVLLMTGIAAKTGDMENVYSRLEMMYTFPREMAVTTKYVWYYFISFIHDLGYTFGTNRNKGNKSKKVPDYIQLLMDANALDALGINGDEFEYDFEIDRDDDGTKYAGAYIANVEYMQSTGFKIMGKESNTVHEMVADSDVTSEYPTALMIENASNETLVGKVLLEDPSEIDIPIPEGYKFYGDEKSKYKMDTSNYLLEVYSERDVFNFGSLFMGLPSVNEMMDELADIIKPTRDIIIEEESDTTGEVDWGEIDELLKTIKRTNQ